MGTNGLFTCLNHLILRLIGHTHAKKSLLSVLKPLLDTVVSLCLMDLDNMPINSTHSLTHSLTESIKQAINKSRNK